MKVIAMVNYKGGVGKTTLTANICAELARRGKKMLAIDLDPQANLTFSFLKVELWKNQYQENKTIKKLFEGYYNVEYISLKELVIKPERINEITNNHLDLISSHMGLVNVEIELAMRLSVLEKQFEENFIEVLGILRQALDNVKDDYDIVMIDCPPNFNLMTKNAIVACDYYMVPTKLDYLSTLGIEHLHKHIHDLVKEYNAYCSEEKTIQPKLIGVVGTMVSYWKNELISVNHQYLNHIKQLALPIFDVKVRENKTCYADAPEYGIPLILQDIKESSINIQEELEKLTNEFSEKVGIIA